MLALTIVPTTAGIFLAIRLWPNGPEPVPLEVSLAMLALLTGAVIAVIVLVRYFFHPFQEMADSRAELQTLYREA
ncbi:MAG TPA: hypothetical protein VK987_10525, partial [Anaerolineae bacterium]|nr:hypothetical protein [Anaerolineae bacterium]